jgi:oxygen-independent coproporphyrinogen-3 oxidase
MNQKTLDLIGRRHTVLQVIDAFKLARECGFDNINMDLIVGLPGETMEDVRHTMEEVKKLSPDNLTVHSLAIKRAAALNYQKAKFTDKIMNTDEIINMTAGYAKDMGLNPYYLYRQKNMAGNFENVGYAKEGYEGLYNILIMEERQSIIALGAGASSKFVFPKENRIERAENVKDVKSYIERIDEMIDRKRAYLEN